MMTALVLKVGGGSAEHFEFLPDWSAASQGFSRWFATWK